MTFMTKNGERLLAKLVHLAGSAALVEDTLRDLNESLPEPPTVEQLVVEILTRRARQIQAGQARASQPVGIPSAR